MTWISTVLAIILNNLKPVLVDIRSNSPLMDLKILKKNQIQKQSHSSSASCMVV